MFNRQARHLLRRSAISYRQSLVGKLQVDTTVATKSPLLYPLLQAIFLLHQFMTVEY